MRYNENRWRGMGISAYDYEWIYEKLVWCKTDVDIQWMYVLRNE